LLAIWIPDPLLCKAIASACGVAYYVIDQANRGNGVIISISTLVPIAKVVPFNIKAQ